MYKGKLPPLSEIEKVKMMCVGKIKIKNNFME